MELEGELSVVTSAKGPSSLRTSTCSSHKNEVAVHV